MKVMLKFKLLLPIMLFACNSNIATAELRPEYYISKWRMKPNQTAIVSKGSGPLRILYASKSVEKESPSIFREVRQSIENKPILAFLMIDENNNIIFESYMNGAHQDDLIIGHSMTKSISSIIIGQYLCDGLIGSLNDRAEKYSSSLKGTAYGDATIKELLMMTSTGSIGVAEGGNPTPDFRNRVVQQKLSLRDAFIEFGMNHNNPAPKGVFSYKGLDTAAISILIADIKNTKYQNVISQNLWSKIGAEKNAEIEVDKNNDAFAQGGLGATARDWARLGIYVRDNIKNNSCFGSYLREATAGQIKVSAERITQFSKYGYQFWTDNKLIATKSAWFLGVGGQQIGIDLLSGKIIVRLSYDEKGVWDTYKIFDSWTHK